MSPEELLKNYLPESVAGKNVVIPGGTAGIGRDSGAAGATRLYNLL
jgi:hypothetical protein